MNDTTKRGPLAAALAKVLDNSSVCPEGYYHDSMRRLFVALQTIDHGYRDLAGRPHSVSGHLAELERRASELQREHGIMLSILDEAGTVEVDDAEQITIGWAARSKA